MRAPDDHRPEAVDLKGIGPKAACKVVRRSLGRFLSKPGNASFRVTGTDFPLGCSQAARC